MICSSKRHVLHAVLIAEVISATALPARFAIAAPPVEAVGTVHTADTPAPTEPKSVDVRGVVDDRAIARRLKAILDATPGWFPDATVEVKDGVAVLGGTALTEEHKAWAGRLARETQGVVAAINQIQVADSSLWDLSESRKELRGMWRELIRLTPRIVASLIVLAVTIALTLLGARIARALLRRRFDSELLVRVGARALAAPLFIFGLYVMLRVTGLTRLALTVLGGTGVFGLILGIGFRDIAENFLASILISTRRPFRAGDTIQVDTVTGIVQKVTTRGTIVMTFSGNHVLIPNAIIYKSIIHNFTTNPNVRIDFLIGIGYDDSIVHAQEVGMELLRAHEAVLADPPPMILVETLGPATVDLRVYYWIDATKHSFLRVQSSVMRAMKRAYQTAGISLPDAAREVLFPQGVPIRMLDREGAGAGTDAAVKPREPSAPIDSAEVVSMAEGGLESEAEAIQQQADQAQDLESGESIIPGEPKART
ncbi:MAG: mechanosensitive ion channel [Myxococcales bacterium]|nr:mechanosensitive ion channel [Myxococcales bacterium]